MPGFKVDGSLMGSSGMGSKDSTIFSLRDAGGLEVKTYVVPNGKADGFESEMRLQEPLLRKQYGQTKPLRLVKIQSCF